ncbi:MAG TPA: hypothetical protein PKJ63_01515 [Cyclobacteriaceae bacterium]|nr:hypothetical protein [Cyclobacteriaceae bacterium]
MTQRLARNSFISLLSIAILACTDPNESQLGIDWGIQDPSNLVGTSWRTTNVTFINNWPDPDIEENFASACDRPNDAQTSSMDYLKFTLNYFQQFSVTYTDGLNIVSMEPCVYPATQTLLVDNGDSSSSLYFEWESPNVAVERPGFKIEILEQTATTLKIRVLSNLMAYREDIYGVIDLVKE